MQALAGAVLADDDYDAALLDGSHAQQVSTSHELRNRLDLTVPTVSRAKGWG